MSEMKQCPKCGSKHIIGVSYLGGVDSVSEWQCQNCEYRQGRWTGQELPVGFIESPYGRQGVVRADE